MHIEDMQGIGLTEELAVPEFANTLQVCVDAGAKRVLLPSSSVQDLQTVPSDLLVKIQPIFYSDPIDAVYKALGVN